MHRSRWLAATLFPVALVAAVTLFTAIAVTPASANWSNTGNIVASGSGDEQTGFGFAAAGTAVAPDATGGCYVAYMFATNLDSIRINRLSGDNGARLWGTTGVKVNQGGNAGSSAPFVVSDLAGGCWVVWIDNRSGNPAIYAQRFDPSGARGGPDGGFLVANTTGTSQPFGPAIAASAGGDLLIAFWRTASLGLQVMRIHMVFTGAAPTIELAESQMTTDTGSASDAPIQLFADGTGGGVVVWASNRASLPGGAGTVKVVANRFNSTGVKQWGAEGSVVQAGVGASATQDRAYWDGTNLFVCWTHGTATSVTGIHAQKMNGTGVAQWGSTTTGVTVMTETPTGNEDFTSTNVQPQICSDGGTGVWVSWIDGRNWHQLAPNGFEHAQDIFAQRLNSAGVAQLTANGVGVDVQPGSVAELKTTPGASGELLLAYRTLLFEAGTLGDIILARANTSGAFVSNAILNKTGNPNTSDDKQSNPVVAADGFGGAFVAWDDNRANPNLDVYASHRTGTLALTGPTLSLVSPNGGEVLAGLEPFNITWSSTMSAGATVKLEYKFGATRTLITASTANDGAFTWSTPIGGGGSNYTVVVSESGDGTPRDSSNATFTICAPIDIPGSYGPTTTPLGGVLADLNHDGILDLIVTDNTGISAELGTGTAGVGDGGFDVPVHTGLGLQGNSLAVGDFNGDGSLDVAVTLETGVRLAMGNGTASFTAGSTFAAGSSPRGLVAADFNEDGILDLAVANSAGNSVSTLQGLGTSGVGNGTFAPAVNHAVGTSPSRIIAQDFDNNSILDLAVTNSTGASVSILMGGGNNATGLGDGTFAPALSFATGASPVGLCASHFNSDGFFDLAVATSTGVSVLIGQGTGSFLAAVTYSLATPARDVVAGDFDGDGREDLMCAANTSNKVFLLFGDGTGTVGDGTFTVGGSSPAGTSPTQLLLGDLLEDNALDGVMVNTASNDVFPFWGECPTALSAAVTVTSPNGGETFAVGSGHTLTWTRGPGVPSVDIDVSRDNGAHWQTIATNWTDTHFFWNVTPPQALGTARIRVRDSNLQNRNDQSDLAFSITDGTVGVEPGTLPLTASFSAGRPNPARGPMVFEMALPKDGDVLVDVFDLAGRRVETLANGRWAAGYHLVRWAGGRSASPGVYFVRARWQGYDVTRTVVRMQ